MPNAYVRQSFFLFFKPTIDQKTNRKTLLLETRKLKQALWQNKSKLAT